MRPAGGNARLAARPPGLGFAYEGTFRQAVVVKGRNRDTPWFALLDRDWASRRAAFAEWFARLDADGRQTVARPCPSR